MSATTVEFFCHENVATPGTKAAPRPADRPRPSLTELKARRLAVQSFDGDSENIVREPKTVPPERHPTA